jgi:hypothetical protein
MSTALSEILFTTVVFLPKLPLPEREFAPGSPRPLLAYRVRSIVCRPHIVMAATASKLVLMIVFLALLLERLKENFVASWFFVFTPLWISDAMVSFACVVETQRRLRAEADSASAPSGRARSRWARSDR